MTLVAYTDGSGTMAHLPCGAGVVVYDDGVPVLEASRFLGNGTNNHAEISAWLRSALAQVTRPMSHGGNHRYLVPLSRTAKRCLAGCGLPYPKAPALALAEAA